MKKQLTLMMLLSFFIAGITQAEAISIELDFNSLPSTQGWTYEGGSLSENIYFSTGLNYEGIPTLFQDTVTNDALAVYTLRGQIMTDLDYSITIRARVLAESGPASTNSYGFYFGGMNYLTNSGETERVQFGIGTNRLEAGSTDITPGGFDGTIFHTYRVDVTPRWWWI